MFKLSNTSLEAFLSANEIKKLILIGVSTDMAVQSTARDGHDRDYQIIIIPDACAAGNEELHETSIRTMQRIAKTMTASELETCNLFE